MTGGTRGQTLRATHRRDGLDVCTVNVRQKEGAQRVETSAGECVTALWIWAWLWQRGYGGERGDTIDDTGETGFCNEGLIGEWVDLATRREDEAATDGLDGNLTTGQSEESIGARILYSEAGVDKRRSGVKYDVLDETEVTLCECVASGGGIEGGTDLERVVDTQNIGTDPSRGRRVPGRIQLHRIVANQET